MRALQFITGHVIHKPAYTYKFQLKTTHDKLNYLAFNHAVYTLNLTYQVSQLVPTKPYLHYSLCTIRSET